MYQRKDYFYQKAKKEGFASRAVYKILEIQKRFKIIKPGDGVLDLGCAPGGFLPTLAKEVGPKGLVIGVDRLPLKIQPPSPVVFIQKTIEDESLPDAIARLTSSRKGLDVMVSDLSPDLSGIAFRDTALSHELALKVWKMGQQFLKNGGHLVMKIFPGDETGRLKAELKRSFKRVVSFVPEATRKTSSEVYWIALDFVK